MQANLRHLVKSNPPLRPRLQHSLNERILPNHTLTIKKLNFQKTVQTNNRPKKQHILTM